MVPSMVRLQEGAHHILMRRGCPKARALSMERCIPWSSYSAWVPDREGRPDCSMFCCTSLSRTPCS